MSSGTFKRVRDLPSVEKVVVQLESRYPRRLLVAETRRVLAEMRAEILSGREPDGCVEEKVAANLDRLAAPSLRPVINATGVVLHTNLGRAPWPDLPRPPVIPISNTISNGRRGKRDVHSGGADRTAHGAPGIVVNNNAAAIYLALNELAAGDEVVVPAAN